MNYMTYFPNYVEREFQQLILNELSGMVKYVYDRSWKYNGHMVQKSKFFNYNHTWYFISKDTLVFIFVTNCSNIERLNEIYYQKV